MPAPSARRGRLPAGGGVLPEKGWAEQADAFGDYLDGKTPDEVKKLKTDEDGKPQDADLLSGCTIAVDRYRDAVVRACEQAKALGAAKGDTVSLGLRPPTCPGPCRHRMTRTPTPRQTSRWRP